MDKSIIQVAKISMGIQKIELFIVCSLFLLFGKTTDSFPLAHYTLH